METLPDQFGDALSRIEIKGEKRERAVAAQTEIRDYLEADGYLCSVGVDTVLIGSFARQTGIDPGKDVDVFVKLMKLDTTVAPSVIYEATRASSSPATANAPNHRTGRSTFCSNPMASASMLFQRSRWRAVGDPAARHVTLVVVRPSRALGRNGPGEARRPGD